MPYRTLVVAPKTDLVLVEDEVLSVVNMLRAYSLRDFVTANQVLDKLSEGWDIIWFMTHGTAEGILLSDGPLNASALTTMIRTSGARLVVLNTCQSIHVALDIHNELLTNLVCTLREVPDREAYFTGKQLALHLSRGKNFSQAYLAAKPGQNTNYIFLVGKDAEHEGPGPAAVSAPTNVNVRVGEAIDYGEQIRRLELALRGDVVGAEGLITTVKSILIEVNNIKRAILIMQIGGVSVLIITFIILITVISIYVTRGL